MKVEAVQDAVLSNGEAHTHFIYQWRTRELRVLEHEKKKESERKKRESGRKSKDDDSALKPKRDKIPENYKKMKEDLNSYIYGGRGANALPNYGKYPAGSIRKLLQDLKKFELTKAELVMILNLAPKDAVALDVIIEELDTRLPESDDQEELLGIINQILGAGWPEDEEAMQEVAETGDGMEMDPAGE